jgi:hypothetical protein
MSAAADDPAMRADRAEDDVADRDPLRERARLADVIASRLLGEGDTETPTSAQTRLGFLASLFDLSAFETDAIAVLWTTAFDPELRAAFLRRDRLNAQITPRVIAEVFGHRAIVRLPSESALRRWQLVEEHPMIDGSAVLSIDPQIIAWLQCEPELDRTLLGRAAWIEPAFELPSWPLERWVSILKDGLQNGVRWRIRLETVRSLRRVRGRSRTDCSCRCSESMATARPAKTPARSRCAHTARRSSMVRRCISKSQRLAAAYRCRSRCNSCARLGRSPRSKAFAICRCAWPCRPWRNGGCCGGAQYRARRPGRVHNSRRWRYSPKPA